MGAENGFNNPESEVQVSDGVTNLEEMAGKFDPDEARRAAEARKAELESESAIETTRQVLLDREAMVYTEVVAANPNVKVVDEGRNLYSFKVSDDLEVFGSVYSILDMHEDLGAMSDKAESIRSGSGEDSLMGIQISEGAGYESVVVASGSFAQREINPYPADMDFAEHLHITAENAEESGKMLSALIVSTIEKSTKDDGTVFTRLKVGSYPPEAGDKAGKTITWNKDEIAAGQKVIKNESGEEITISLQQACEQPGSFVKMDWLTMVDDQVKEMTKVINLSVSTPSGEEIFNNSMPSSAFQEIYFGDPSNFGITEKTLEPEVSDEYLAFLKKDVGKYSAPGHENFLKVAKRSYNYLKCSGRVREAKELAPLFNSPISELASRSESLSLLPDFLEKGGKQIDPNSLSSSLSKIGQVVDSLTQDGTISSEEQAGITQALASLPDQIASDPSSARTTIEGLTSLFSSKINQKSQSFLSGLGLPQKVMV